MWVCPTCQEAHEDHFDACWRCAADAPAGAPDELAPPLLPTDVPMATTDQLPGHQIVRLCGVVSGLAIRSPGPDLGLGLEAAFGGPLGGRHVALEAVLQTMRNEAVEAMLREARALGANAVLRLHIQYPPAQGSPWVLAVSGTAVVAVPQGGAAATGETRRLA